MPFIVAGQEERASNMADKSAEIESGWYLHESIKKDKYNIYCLLLPLDIAEKKFAIHLHNSL